MSSNHWSVGVVGGGVVGSATARSYVEWAESVRVFDVVPERRTATLPEVLSCSVVFVCLPTPSGEGGGLNTSVLDEFFDMRQGTDTVYVLKSTVPVGYTKSAAKKYRLPNLVHSPEFLTARCAAQDAMMPTRNIIGAPDYRDKWWGGVAPTLSRLYRERFPHVPVRLMSSDESEAVKIFINSFFAVKVAFWNEARALADKTGLDWGRVMTAILGDCRINPSHTLVPGPDGKRGFGGTCLPKDLSEFITCSLSHGLSPTVSEGAARRNREDRRE